MARVINADDFYGINEEQTDQKQMIAIKQIDPNENNFYGIRDLDELKESIEQFGFQGEIIVKKNSDNNRYTIVSGERRYRACLELGFKEIPAIVYEFESDAQEDEMLVKMNSATRELTEKERAIQMAFLKSHAQKKKQSGMKGRLRDIIADTANISPSTVQRQLTINENLIPELKDLLYKGDITNGIALDVAKSMDQETQHQFYKELADILRKNDHIHDSDKENIDILKEQFITQQKQKDDIIRQQNERISQIQNDKRKEKQVKDQEIKKLEKQRNELLSQLENKNAEKTIQDLKAVKETLKREALIQQFNASAKELLTKILSGAVTEEELKLIDKQSLEQIIIDL